MKRAVLYERFKLAFIIWHAIDSDILTPWRSAIRVQTARAVTFWTSLLSRKPTSFDSCATLSSFWLCLVNYLVT